MQTWIEIDKYCSLNDLDIHSVKQKIDNNELNSRVENGITFIEIEEDTYESDFHQQMIEAKDMTIEALQSENQLLKESLYMLQEMANEDQDTIKLLKNQLKHVKEELDFTRKKYKLIWDKTIEDFAQSEKK